MKHNCKGFSNSCFLVVNFCVQEELRPYFSLPKVMDGLFSLANMLFGVDIEPADGLAPVTFQLLHFCFIVVYYVT